MSDVINVQRQTPVIGLRRTFLPRLTFSYAVLAGGVEKFSGRNGTRWVHPGSASPAMSATHNIEFSQEKLARINNRECFHAETHHQWWVLRSPFWNVHTLSAE